MMVAGGIALLLGGVSVVAAPAKLRTAVIAVGPDDVAAGQLQQRLESSLAGVPGVEIVPGSLTAAALASTTSGALALPSPDLRAIDESNGMFERVERQYLVGDMNEALRILQEIEALHERTRHVPTAERARLLLWRATIALTQGDPRAANDRVRSAVALDPAAEVDARVFPPSIRRIADAERERGFRRVKLEVRGAPPGAVVLVDGRPAPPEGIPTGTNHVVAVGAPGYRWTEEIFRDVQADVVHSVSLALAPGAEMEQVLRTTALAGSETRPPPELPALAARIGADALVVVTHVQGGAGAADCEPASGAEGRRLAGVFWRDAWKRSLFPAPRRPDDAKGSEQFAQWLDGMLQDATGGFFSSLGTTASAGFGVGSRYTNFYDVDGDGYRTTFAGPTFTGGIGIGPDRWVASLDGTFVHYGWSSVEIAPEGDVIQRGPGRGRRDDLVAASGGHVFSALLSGGRRFLVTGSFERGLWWGVEGTFQWEWRLADDVEERGRPLGLFPSHDRVALGARVRGGAPIPWTPLVAEGWVSVFPLTQLMRWREFPAGTSGTDPEPDPRGGAELTVAWRPSRSAARLMAVFQLDATSVSYQGRARAPSQPAIVGGRRDEAMTAVLFRVEWQP